MTTETLEICLNEFRYGIPFYGCLCVVIGYWVRSVEYRRPPGP